MSGYTTLDQAICAVKSETSYGVDAFGASAPTSDDTLAFRSLTITPIYEVSEPDRVTATASGECHTVYFSHNEVAWESPLIGSVDAGDLPIIDAILRAGNFKRVIDAGTSVTYTPSTANDQSEVPSATFLMYQRSIEDNTGKRLMSRGSKTDLTFTFEQGSEAFLAGTALGLFDAVPATMSNLPTLPTTYNTDQCGWMINKMAVTVGNVSYPVSAFEVSSNFVTSPQGGGAEVGAGGIRKIVLTKGKSGNRIGGSLTLVDGSAALTDMITQAYAASKASLTVVITKGARTCTFSMPAIQFGVYTDASPTYTVPFFAIRPAGTAGDNELVITFT